MSKEEIIYELHRIRRELANNYDDLDFSERERDDISGYLKEALDILEKENEDKV